MKEQAKALSELFFKLMFPDGSSTHDDYVSRPLHCTPYEGEPGIVSGWVVCVSGSPPKGRLIIPSGYRGRSVHYLGDGRRLEDPKEKDIVEEFYQKVLKDKTEGFTIDLR